MFKDQFGNKLNLGDTVIYTRTRNSYGATMKPTIARITKLCAYTSWRGKESSYISVKPLVGRARYNRDGPKTTYELECSRQLRKISRVLKVDNSMLDNLIGQPTD